MSGLALGLLLFEDDGSEGLPADVVSWLATFCATREILDDGFTFRILDSGPLGVESADLDLDSLSDFSVTEDAFDEDDDFAALPQRPVREFTVISYASSDTHHVLLGHLALALARRLNALIDFDGVLGYAGTLDESRVAGELARARALVADLPGTLVEVSYETARGHCCYRHVGDAEFLAAWLRHPRFRLVK